MQRMEQHAKEFEEELHRVFRYWATEGFDPDTGYFYGIIDHFGHKDASANKGIIMYTRQLWAFSAAAIHYQSEAYARIADRCYVFLQSHFYDSHHGGYIWETDTVGHATDTKKQTYAQAFALYALTQYYSLRKYPEVYGYANQQFECIMDKCFDDATGGFLEGFSQDWQFDKGNRLSDKDSFADKSMNTNLHILEAFTSFYAVFRTQQSHDALKRVVLDFAQYIIGPDKHLILFMDDKWHAESTIHSYGHDIETSWLLWEAAETLADKVLSQHLRVLVLGMVDSFVEEGIDADGAVMNEKNTTTGHIDTDRYWWPQCEGLEGLANAYGMTGNAKYLDAMLNIWQFIKDKMLDHTNGEWYTRIDASGAPVVTEHKGGMWKTPYHNGRALMRLAQRFGTLPTSGLSARSEVQAYN